MPFILELLIKFIIYFIIIVPIIGIGCLGVAWLMIWVEERIEKHKVRKKEQKNEIY